MDWIRAIYGVLGADYPVLSLVGAGLLGAFLFSGAWWLAGRDYRKEHPPIATEAHLPMANEGAERKVFPETAKPSAKPNAPSHQPPRAIATQQAENNRSPGANIYQAGRDIVLTQPAATELRVRSLTLELRLTCLLKTSHGDLPPDEVPFLPVGDANAYLDGPAGRQRLIFASPVRFRRLADDRIVIVNRFVLDPAGDLVNQPIQTLTNYQNVIAPVITIVWGKEFQKFTLLELSLSLNGADPAYSSWPYDAPFQNGPVFTVPFDNFKKKLGL